MLSLLHTRYTKNNKRKENTNFPNRHYHIQDIKYVKNKNVNMTWDYWNFPRHQVAAKKFEIRGRNTILLHYHYRVDPELGKYVCENFRILCACKSCVAQIDKYWLPTIATSSQPRYDRVENCYHKKLEHKNDWIIMKLLDNKTPHVEF